MQTTYPEINELNLKETRAVLRMAYNLFESVNEEAQPELANRIAALEVRRDRLEATRAANDRVLERLNDGTL